MLPAEMLHQSCKNLNSLNFVLETIKLYVKKRKKRTANIKVVRS